MRHDYAPETIEIDSRKGEMMDEQLIAMNLSDGTGCYGRRVEGRPHLWWLRRTTTTVYRLADQVAPPWARQQAEQKLAARQWEIGGVIQITQPGSVNARRT